MRHGQQQARERRGAIASHGNQTYANIKRQKGKGIAKERETTPKQ